MNVGRTLKSMAKRLVSPADPLVISAAPPKEAQTAVEPLPATASAAPLLSIIQPQARDRWLSASVKQFTPERVEQTIRGAMSGNLVAQWEMFDLMEGTWPRLAKNLCELKDAVKALEWNVQPWAAQGEKPSDEAQRRARLLDDVMWSMSPKADQDENDFEDLLGDIMDAWGKGISIQEIDWEIKRYEGGSVIAPRASRWVHPRYYGYPLQSTRLMINAREARVPVPEAGTSGSHESVDGFIPFLDGKFLISVAKQKSGPPIGAALLRLLGFWWSASNFVGEWFLNFAQIFGQPIRWASYDVNASKATISAIEDMLENMGSAAWACFPAGTVLELKEAMKSGTDNPQKAVLDVADTACDILVLRQTLTTDAGDKGTQALGTVHAGIRADVIQAVGNWVAKILNQQFVPWVCIFNFGDKEECPWLMPSLKQVKDSKAMAERDQILLDAGADLPRSWFYARHDVPIPAAGEEVIKGGMNLSRALLPGSGAPGTPADKVAARLVIRAKAVDKLAENVLEDLTGVEARWLGGVKPAFQELVLLALDGTVSDDDFIAAVEKAQKQMPELFDQLDRHFLADSLERALGPAVVNGAVQGAMKRLRNKPAKEAPSGGAP